MPAGRLQTKALIESVHQRKDLSKQGWVIGKSSVNTMNALLLYCIWYVNIFSKTELENTFNFGMECELQKKLANEPT